VIVDLGKAISFLKVPTTVKRFVDEVYVNGEVEKSYSESEEIPLVCIPLSGSEIRNQPTGEYDSDDLNVFQGMESMSLQKRDIVIRKNKIYEIRSEVDYAEIAGIKKFIAKKL
jgi:hypothetical protein